VLIVDTGPLVAAADRDDEHHAQYFALLDSDPGPFITTSMVIAEAAYLINRQLGPDAEAALYEWILDGTLHVEALTIDDWQRVHDLVEQYSDLPLGGTDSSLVAIAERLQASRLATIDRTHFRVVRPAHVDAFDLILPPA